MAFSWLSRWLNRTLQPTRRPGGRHRRSTAFPRLEELEPRWVPSNYYLVRGSSTGTTTLTFNLTNRQSNFNDEIGVYVLPNTIANDDLGTVTMAASGSSTTTTNFTPSQGGYANAVLSETLATAGATVTSGQRATLFTPNQPAGAMTTLTFNGNSLLGFYLVQNGTAAGASAFDAGNTVNNTQGGPVAFFSFDAADPDNFDHTSSVLFGDGSAQFNWDDQTGGGFPQNFNAAVFTVGVTNGSGVSLPGGTSQTVPATFTLDGRNGNSDEMGVFSINQPNGQITSGGKTLNPGDAGYVQAALSSAKVVFTGSQTAGATTTVNLPGGGLFGMYLVQNGTTANALASDPTDQATGTPQVYFSFVGANPDQVQHLRWQDSSTFGWDDQAGGGNLHYDALTATLTFGAVSPTHFVVGNAPTTATAGNTFNFTVTAEDANNNPVTNYTGTVNFTSTDTAAVLPANTTLTNGTGTFSATLKTAGAQTITATDTANSTITGTTAPITVNAAAATKFAVSAPSTAVNGTLLSFTVTAQDAFNNTATGYAGTVHITSSDAAAVLPSNAALTHGTATFNAVLKTTGNQTLTATDTTNSSITGTSGTINVAASTDTPTVTTAISNVSVAKNASPTTLDMASNFGDPDITDFNTTVSFQTSSGTVNLVLFDKTTPATVQNFVDYILAGNYNNSIFHRLVSGFVLQGGYDNFVASPASGQQKLQQIPVGPTIPNEPGVSNVADTIAMAKVGGNPNSATNQFFFNLANNRGTPPNGLDFQNGGFTAFGELADQASISALTTLASEPTTNQSQFDSNLSTLPSTFINSNDTAFPGDTTAADYELISSASVKQVDSLTYSIVSNSNPGLVTATQVANHPEQLNLAYTAGTTGTATIVVKAANQHGQSVTQSFTVTVS